jgi:hypothetical protein
MSQNSDGQDPSEQIVVNLLQAVAGSRRHHVRQQLEAAAQEVLTKFTHARGGPLPAAATEREKRLAIDETLKSGVDRPYETLRLSLAQAYWPRLLGLWNRTQPGLPEFRSNDEAVSAWQSEMLATIKRHHTAAPLEFERETIPVYAVKAFPDRTLTLNNAQPVAWRTLGVNAERLAHVYGIPIPQELAAPSFPLGKILVLDASPSPLWPLQNDAPVLIAVSPLAENSVVQWLGHLAEVTEDDLIVRQTDEADVSLQIGRKGIIIHRVIQIID